MLYDPLLVEQYGGVERYRALFFDHPVYRERPRRTAAYGLFRALAIQAPTYAVLSEASDMSRPAIFATMIATGIALSNLHDLQDTSVISSYVAPTVVETA